MTLKTYQGSTMAEALAQVKRDLGPDAVILQTRTVRRGGVLGIGARESVEITASTDVNVRPRTSGRTSARLDGLARMFGQSSVPPADTPKPDKMFSQQVKEELAGIRGLVGDLVRQTRAGTHPDVPEELFNVYLRLLEGEVADELARQFVRELKSRLAGDALADGQRIDEALVECISRTIPVAGPVRLDPTGGMRTVALIGPTGVGKTTTIAKLAANFKLRENRRVGLVTIDTYRIAAVNQLATYAQIIDVPLKVVLTPEQLRQATDSLAESCDLVLVDTAGRSPNDPLKLNELRNFLAAARPHETHLVLSSTCQPTAMRAAIERFRPLGVDRVILTKLDEAVSFGLILEVVRQVKASLSYVTIGQDVPDDIEVGCGRKLARWIINRSLADRAAEPPSGKAAANPVKEGLPAPAEGVAAHA